MRFPQQLASKPGSRLRASRGPHFRRGLGASWMLVLGLTWNGEAQSQTSRTDEVTARLELSAPKGCGSKAELVRRIELRSDRVRFVSQPQGARGVFATIQRKSENSFVATLTLVHPSGKRSSRRVGARNCDDALDALALIAAVSLDPMAADSNPQKDAQPSSSSSSSSSSSTPSLPSGSGGAASSDGTRGSGSSDIPPANSTKSPSAAKASATPTSAAKATAAKASAAKASATTRPKPLDPDDAGDNDGELEQPSSQDSPGSGTGFRFLAGASGEANTGAAPGWLPGIALHAGLEAELGGWTPALLVSAAHAQRNSFEARGGRAEFSLDVLRLELCPIRLGTLGLSIRPCATSSAGTLRARGYQTAASQTRTRPWWASGASLILAYEPSAPLQLVANFSATLPWMRDRFQFQPEVFHRVSRVAVGLGLGVGLRIP